MVEPGACVSFSRLVIKACPGGDGDLRDFIKLSFEKEGILRNVRFAGMRKDMPE